MMTWFDQSLIDWLAMSVVMTAFWLMLIILVVWAIKSSPEHHDHPAPEADLERRFAAGDLTADELVSKRELLQLHPHGDRFVS